MLKKPRAIPTCSALLAISMGFGVWLMAGAGPAATGEGGTEITRPPAWLETDPFYKKYLSAKGLPILGSEKVSDLALREAAFLIDQMLAHRPEIRKALIEADVRVVVMHSSEMTTDVPEQRHMKPKAFWDLRARGLGGRITSCGQENLLNEPGDRYPTENILIHEFAHCMHGHGLGRIDKEFDRRLRAVYDRAMAKGLWKGTYAATSVGEYWAEGVQSWFDTNRQNDRQHNHVNTREELKEYDPDLARLLAEVYGDGPWRYRRHDGRKLGGADPLFFFKRFYVDREYGGNGRPGFVRAGDMDGDGDLDLVAGGGRALFIYENLDRDRRWTRFGNLDGTGEIGLNGAALADVDGDEDLDVVGAEYKGDMGWWENPGPPLRNDPWPFHELFGTRLYLHDLILADLDGDGKAREFIATLNGGGYWHATITVMWFRPAADPRGLWERHTVEDARAEGESHCHAGLDVGDIDGDGDADIAFSNGWYESPGARDGTWVWHPVTTTVRGISNAKLGDLDGDGDLDLIASAGHHGRGVFWFACPDAPATGTWTKHTVDASIANPEGLGLADLDRDGDLEIVACELDFEKWDQEVHRIYVYERRGTPPSFRWRKHDASGESFASHKLQIADVNGDGKPDIIGEGCGYKVVSYYENSVVGPHASAHVPARGRGPGGEPPFPRPFDTPARLPASPERMAFAGMAGWLRVRSGGSPVLPGGGPPER